MLKDHTSLVLLPLALFLAACSTAAAHNPEPSAAAELAPNREATSSVLAFTGEFALATGAIHPAKENLISQFAVSVKHGEVGSVKVRHVMPPYVAPEHRNHLFIHLHGGTYVGESGDASIAEAVLIAYRAQIPVLFIDYRLPPKHPFPAAVQDVVSVYLELLKERPARSMALGGTSAGGGLALAATHVLVEGGHQVPAALFAGAPWADLTETRDSTCTNNGIDASLVPTADKLGAAANAYAGRQNMNDPLISPVNGNFGGFPPTYFVAGTRDLFLSDTARVHRRLRMSGVVAELNIYAGVSQADEISVFDSPYSQQAYEELGAFLQKYLK